MEKLDVVYLAPDLGSLLGAVALAAGGLKVLVLDEGPARATRKLDEADKVFANADKEPFLLRGLRPGGFLEPLLNRLGLLNRAREVVERIDPPFQVITPEARVDVWSGKEDLAREFAREFGTAAKGASAVFQGFEQLGAEVYKVAGGDNFPAMPKGLGAKFFKRVTTDPEVEPLRNPPLSKIFQDHSIIEPVRSFIAAACAALGVPADNGLPASAAAALIDSARRGIYRADIVELTKMVLDTFKSRGGYTFPIGELESIDMSQREIGALRMAKSNYIKSKLFVGSVSRLAQYMPKEIVPAMLPAGAPRLHRLDVLLASDAIPVGMKDRVVALPRPADVIFPEYVARIAISQVVEVEGAPMRIVSAESLRLGVEDIREELKDYLLGIIPFMDEYLKRERYSAEPVPRSMSSRRSFLDLPETGPIDNLLSNEGDLLAEMGLGDGVVSGRILPRIILRKLGLRAEI